MTNTASGAEAIAAAERNADLLTARAASGDPSAIPSICRISTAAHYSSGIFETSLVAPFELIPSFFRSGILRPFRCFFL